MTRLIGYLIVSAAVVLSGIWVAGQADLHTFSPGDIIRSDEVNENFENLATELELKQNRIDDECATGSAIRVVNEDGTVECQAVTGNGVSDAWLLSGNAGTTAGEHFIGTIDDEPFEIHVGDGSRTRIARFIPAETDVRFAPNVLLGSTTFAVPDDLTGATISGGVLNSAVGNLSTVGGGQVNTAFGNSSTVAGGFNNEASGRKASVGGGRQNQAEGEAATIAGGLRNVATGRTATVPGGVENTASGESSFAAGVAASALHDNTFVWSDGQPRDPFEFESTDENQFLIHATGGVGINTNRPESPLDVRGEDDFVAQLAGPGFAVSAAGGGSSVFLGGTQSGFFSGGDVVLGSAVELTTSSNNGHVNVGGNLSVSGTKNFRIDHPLDPENKVLHHFAVESNEVLNIYSGTARLDSKGGAIIELPDYFEALNTDFRYQLTPIGASMPELYVAETVAENRFRVAGGEPGKRVSWEVTAVRNDPAVHATKMPVEMEKPAEERGYYLAPEAYGLPPERGVAYQREGALLEQLAAGPGEQFAIGK